MEVEGQPAARSSSSGLEFKLHPLVLINISDHHTRIKVNSADGSGTMVMGCLLGSQAGRVVDISNSFEIEYTRAADGAIVINEAFLARKQEQYKQVFPKVDVLGWYATGARVEDAHMRVHQRIAEINEAPVLLLLDPAVAPGRRDLPLALYEAELHVGGGAGGVDGGGGGGNGGGGGGGAAAAGGGGGGAHFEFVRAGFAVETSEAERIAVDQVARILPGGRATGSEQLNAHLLGLHGAIKMLQQQLVALRGLVARAQAGEVAFPHALARRVSALVHSLPALSSPEFERDFLREHNDALAGLYLATLTRGVAALNDAVDRLAYAHEAALKGGPRRRGGGGGGGGGATFGVTLL